LVVTDEIGPVQQTFAMIKPDAVAKGYTEMIKKRIREDGFAIIQEKLVHLTQTSAEEFYAEHAGKPFFEGLVKQMSRYTL
jgi:nucleoside-diphosphate kinase